MLRILTLSCCLLAAPALAETSALTIGQDRFEAGQSLRFDGPVVADLFMAGNRVTVAAPVGGAAHLAGRRVTVEAAVAGDLFALGYDVMVPGAVGGDASVTGYELTLGPIGGNLRAAGAEIAIASVGGYALITGGEVTLQGEVAGDAVLVADEITFGPAARVAGALTIYAADPARIDVPEAVAPAARVTITQRRLYEAKDWPDTMPRPPSLWQLAGGFAASVVTIALIAALAIALAPRITLAWRDLALAHPGRAVWSGFLVTSALAGSGFVLMLTIIGAVFLPVMLVLTVATVFAGYTLGSYVLGNGLWRALGRPLPTRLWGKFLLAGLGALVAGIAALVPVAGWLFVLSLTLMGVGTLAAFVLPAGRLLRGTEVAP